MRPRGYPCRSIIATPRVVSSPLSSPRSVLPPESLDIKGTVITDGKGGG